MKITELVWNIVDPPYNFYSVRYVLDSRWEHIVYIPTVTIEEELKTQTIVEIVCAKLRAELDCDPVHIDRITKEVKDESRRSATGNSRRLKKR